MTHKDEIVYENLEIQEMTCVKFMGYNLNLNWDGINGFVSRTHPCLGEDRGRDTRLSSLTCFSDFSGLISFINP